MSDMRLLKRLVERAQGLEEQVGGEVRLWYKVVTGPNSYTQSTVDLSLVRWLSEQVVNMMGEVSDREAIASQIEAWAKPGPDGAVYNDQTTELIHRIAVEVREGASDE